MLHLVRIYQKNVVQCHSWTETWKIKSNGTSLYSEVLQYGFLFTLTLLYPREYWMKYRGPDFLAVVWFGSSPPPPLPSVSSTGGTQEDWERETTCWRQREEGGKIKQPQESLALYKWFNTLCCAYTHTCYLYSTVYVQRSDTFNIMMLIELCSVCWYPAVVSAAETARFLKKYPCFFLLFPR